MRTCHRAGPESPRWGTASADRERHDATRGSLRDGTERSPVASERGTGTAPGHRRSRSFRTGAGSRKCRASRSRCTMPRACTRCGTDACPKAMSISGASKSPTGPVTYWSIAPTSGSGCCPTERSRCATCFTPTSPLRCSARRSRASTSGTSSRHWRRRPNSSSVPTAQRRSCAVGASGCVPRTAPPRRSSPNCEALVGVRMRRAGSRWQTTTGGHVLRRRAPAFNDRWNQAVHELHAARRFAVEVAACRIAQSRIHTPSRRSAA